MTKVRKSTAALLAAVSIALSGLASAANKDASVQLITLDPGHFHAALVQKFMLPGVSPMVRVFAPEGDDVRQHLKRVEGINKRADSPTHWLQEVYTGPDYLERAMRTGGAPGSQTAVVISGNNARKSEYIARSIDSRFHVLADKPMVIRPEDLPKLEAAFAAAKVNGVLLYDIMTERFEITNFAAEFCHA